MSDRVLQHVLSDLRPQSDFYFPFHTQTFDDHGCSILSKLKAETNQLTGVGLNGKKAIATTVDTHRGGKTRVIEKPFSR